MLTSEQVQAFSHMGAVTVDGPYSETQLDRAAAAMDRLLVRQKPEVGPEPGHRVQRTNDVFDPDLVDLLQHPFLEQAGKDALCAEAVECLAIAIVKSYPEPGRAFSFWEHVDIKYSTADLDAAPRRMICSFLLWLTDVTPDRAPLMHRPGSHRVLAKDMDARPAYVDNPEPFAKLPRLAWADPVPLLAKRGQITLCTTALVHGASVNTGPLDRKVMFMPFKPKGVELRVNMASVEKRNRYLSALRQHFRPERRHLLPEVREAALA